MKHVAGTCVLFLLIIGCGSHTRLSYSSLRYIR